MNIKKITSIIASIMIVFQLTGCGQKDIKNTTNTENNSTTVVNNSTSKSSSLNLEKNKEKEKKISEILKRSGFNVYIDEAGDDKGVVEGDFKEKNFEKVVKYTYQKVSDRIDINLTITIDQPMENNFDAQSNNYLSEIIKCVTEQEDYNFTELTTTYNNMYKEVKEGKNVQDKQKLIGNFVETVKTKKDYDNTLLFTYLIGVKK